MFGRNFLKVERVIIGIMKTIPLVALGVASLVLSRLAFLFINDPEGPNLLVVAVLAAAIYAVFVTAYFLYSSAKAKQ